MAVLGRLTFSPIFCRFEWKLITFIAESDYASEMKLDLDECEPGYEKIRRGEAGPSSAEIRGAFPSDSSRE